MTTKQMKFESAAHAELLDGIQQLSDAVAVTMGPAGHNVVMDKSYGGPAVSKDGVTVAKEIDLPGKFQNMGAKMVQQVAKKTARKTKSMDVLARARDSSDSESLVRIECQRDQL